MNCKKKYLGVAHEKFWLRGPHKFLPCCTNLLPCLSVCMFSFLFLIYIIIIIIIIIMHCEVGT